MAVELNRNTDVGVSLALTRLREANGVQEAMVFTGSGRMVAFSTNQYGQLLPAMPPAAVMNQLRVARGYSAAEADDPVTAGADGGLHLRVIIALTGPDRYDSPLSAAPSRAGCNCSSPCRSRSHTTPIRCSRGSATTRSWPCRGWACASSTASR